MTRKLLLLLAVSLGTFGGVSTLFGDDMPPTGVPVDTIVSGAAAAAPGETTGGAKERQITAEEQLAIENAKLLILQENHKVLWAALVAGLTPITLLLVLFYLKKTGKISGETIVNSSALVLVIFATIFVIAISNTDQQMTAAIGILGAVIGYIFGQAKGRSEPTPAAAGATAGQEPPKEGPSQGAGSAKRQQEG